MTAISLTVPSVSTARRAKLIFYVRAVVAVAMIGAWAVAAASGLLVVRAGLTADVRLIATGQRSKPRRAVIAR